MDLNTILIILGVVALIILVVHGLWSNRREKSQYFENAATFTRESRIREPRENQQYQTVNNVQHNTPQADSSYRPAKQEPPVQATQPFYTYNEQSAVQNEPQSVDQIKISLPDSEPAYVMREDLSPKPNDYASMSIEELEKSIDLNEGINSSSQRLRQELAQISTQSSADKTELEKNVNVHVESAVLSVEEMPKIESQVEEISETEPKVAENPKPVNPAFVMLYVIASENRGFNGLQLTKTLDELGFIFGKKQIYHRHVDLSITSPVLFSVANIEQPGTFDLANITDFYTVGIALFMQLPSYGNATANLRMMIRAAKTIAQDLGGIVVTDQQEVFDDQAEIDYLARVS